MALVRQPIKGRQSALKFELVVQGHRISFAHARLLRALVNAYSTVVLCRTRTLELVDLLRNLHSNLRVSLNVLRYRDALKGGPVLLSSSQPGQGKADISRNLGTTF